MTLYGWLVRLYPSEFRARFGHELMQVARDHARYGERTTWLGIYGDLVLSALVQQGKDRSMKAMLIPILFIVVVVGGGTMLVTGTVVTVFPLFVAGACGVMYLVASLISRRGTLGAEHAYAGTGKRWWWILAALLGAFQMLFMGGQLVDDPKIENVFALAVIAAFSASIVAGMLIRNRRTGNWMIATGVLPMVPFIWVVVPPVAALVVIAMALLRQHADDAVGGSVELELPAPLGGGASERVVLDEPERDRGSDAPHREHVEVEVVLLLVCGHEPGHVLLLREVRLAFEHHGVRRLVLERDRDARVGEDVLRLHGRDRRRKTNWSSVQTPQTGITCGRPSGRVVDHERIAALLDAFLGP